jgi:predicted oxidoreductase
MSGTQSANPTPPPSPALDAAARADAIVVGAGLAGLVCTLELLRSGHSVLLLDRCRPEQLGGLAREAFGGMFLVDSPEQRRTRIADSERLALEDWLRIAELEPADEWPRRWAEQYVTRARDDVGGWLRELGVRFFPVVNWAERGNFGDGNSVPRFHMTWGTGKALVTAVWRAIERHPRRSALTLQLGARVQELLVEHGHVVGCRVVSESAPPVNGQVGGGVGFAPGVSAAAPKVHETDAAQREWEVRATRAVVVAAGGIGGNLEIVRREWPTELGSPPEHILMGSHLYADGAMHTEVQRIGGNVTHLSRMWNYADAVHHPHPQREGHGLKLIPPRSGVMLSPDGRRYGPVPVMPMFDAYAALQRMCEDERKYSWLICNWKIACRELDVSGSQHNPNLRERRPLRFVLGVLLGKPKLVRHFIEGSPDFLTAQSLRELAVKMNELSSEEAIDAELLEAEIGRYDAAVKRGRNLHNDDQLRRIAQLRRYRGDRLRTCAFAPIVDAQALPLIAIRLQPLARKSLGGIQTDLGGRVLRERDGQPIPGLYAVGEAAGFGGGGVHGKRSLEGTFLGGCVFTGRLAAAAIAGNELPLRTPPSLSV